LSQIYWICTPQKAEKDFKWSAKTSLLDGLTATYQYIKNQQQILKQMPKERKGILWLKYFLVCTIAGILIEVLAAFGNVYFFKPWWIALIVIVGLWGCTFGTLAKMTRVRGFSIQFIIGFIILFGGELLNHFLLDKWYFPEETFLGDANAFVRAAILGLATGFLIPIINMIMIQFYKIKLRLG
jgi:hypothetical protein